MPAGLSWVYEFAARGHSVSLAVMDENLLDLADDLHSSALVHKATTSVPGYTDIVWSQLMNQRCQLHLKARPWESPMDTTDLFFQSDNLLDALLVEKMAGLFRLHAAGLVAPDGSGWLVPGYSGAGKTSLSLAALQAGWRWLSDEWIFIDSGHPERMLGFRRNFNLKEHSFSRFPETAGLRHGRELYVARRQQRVRFVDPEVFAPGKHADSATLSAFLHPVFDRQADKPCLRPLNSVEAAERLIPQLRNGGHDAVSWLIGTITKVPAYELRYADARKIPHLLELALSAIA